jgi:polyvinyl alcohol dehydrogenase (cytochrome)
MPLSAARGVSVLHERTTVVVRTLALAAAAALSALACGDDDDDDAGSNEPEAGAQSDGAAPIAGPPSGVAVWTMMGYDTRNNYRQPEEKTLSVENAGKLEEKWRFKTGGFPAGSPAIADGRVFVMATAGTFALDLRNGAQLWSNPDLAGTASLAYADGALFAHTPRAQLYKLDADDGSVIWGPIATYPEVARCDGTSSPILARGKVLVGHSCGGPEVGGGPEQAIARGGVEAFDIETGERVWTYWTVPESGENGAMVWSSVAVDLESEVVYATTGNNYTLGGGGSDAFHAIELGTGKRKWLTQIRNNDLWSLRGGITATGEDTDFGANPILADVGGRKLVAAGDKGSAFWALDRETGEIAWSRSELSASHSPANGGMLNNGAFDGENFYAASNEPPGEAVLHALRGADGEDVVPPLKLGAIVWGMPSLANGLLFVPADSKLRIFEAATLKELISFDTGGTIAANAPAIADGRVIVKSGLQYGFAPEALANDQVICYGLPGSSAAPGSKPPATDAAVSGAPTWSSVYKDVIVGSGCSGAALCHGGNMGELQLSDRVSAYQKLVGVKAMGSTAPPGNGLPDCKDTALLRVEPGKPDQSLLLLKLEGQPPCGTEMPPGGKLSAAQLEQVRTWITNGAKDD